MLYEINPEELELMIEREKRCVSAIKFDKDFPEEEREHAIRYHERIIYYLSFIIDIYNTKMLLDRNDKHGKN